MTTKPKLRVGSHLLPGLAAVALFVVVATVVLRASFGDPQGFPSDGSITASIGYAMFNLDMGSIPGEGMIVAFIVIAVALDAALDGALLLAKREESGSAVALLADGGRQVRDRLRDDTDADPDARTDTDEGGDR
jgi:NADH-quinone oxidoreductase subunit J